MSVKNYRVFSVSQPLGSTLVASAALTPLGNQRFQPLPPSTRVAPYRLKLSDVITPARLQQIKQAGKLVFHAAGDTGGVKKPDTQRIVASHMTNDLHAGPSGERPAFFYHLGDVVYFYGEAQEYYSQFFDAYEDYDAPIFAIPGNHDGDLPANPGAASLEAFTRNFCASTASPSPDSGDIPRQTMTQPHCYWTLEGPFAHFIGLYTNVPEGGQVDAAQAAWLESELAAAPKTGALILALHHPLYSLSGKHTGSTAMIRLLDTAMRKSKRTPHLVLTAHVHNYQRFSRKIKGHQVPFLVAGAGGYWHLHSVRLEAGQPIITPYPLDGGNLVFERYCDDRHGFLRLEVTSQKLNGTYYTVPRPHESWSAPARRFDTFTVIL